MTNNPDLTRACLADLIEIYFCRDYLDKYKYSIGLFLCASYHKLLGKKWTKKCTFLDILCTFLKNIVILVLKMNFYIQFSSFSFFFNFFHFFLIFFSLIQKKPIYFDLYKLIL